MTPTNTRGATHNFHAPKNWDEAKDGACGALEVRAETYGESGLMQLVSTWHPSADELARLNAGGVIECMLITTGQPPMTLAVVDALVPPAAKPEVPHITINEDAHGDDYNGTCAYPDEN